jgi:golgi phosphoprotein 3
MLSFAEEIVLVALDEHTGELISTSATAFSVAIAGSVLMDLALANRIDTDHRDLWVVDQEPTGNSLLDDSLGRLGAVGERRPTQQVVRALLSSAPALRQQALDRLVAKGMLRRDEKRFLWVFPLLRYPTVDGTERQEVKARLRAIVLGDELPDPRDAVLVTLVSACRLFPEMLTPAELNRAHDRIAAVARLDLIGQQVARLIRGIEEELLMATEHMG